MYDRAVLILDTTSASLGDIALGLIAMGIHPYYANNVDDAIFLAAEHRSRIGAVAAPTELLIEHLDVIRKDVLAEHGVPIASVVPIGNEPSPSERELLVNAGLRFGAFGSHSPRDLRFVIALAISSSDRREARREMRVPCELKVEVTTGERTFRASLADLSTGGAYIASRSPLRPGTPLQLAFDVGATRVSTRAEVKWRTALDGGFAGWLDAGMGVAFVECSEEARGAILRHVGDLTRRFELREPALETAG